MATKEIKLPDIGEGVTEGELVGWLVKEGDQIELDQPVVELMTDKATVEIPCSTPGTVKELKFSEGDTIEVGSVFMVIEEGATAAASAPAEKTAAPAAPQAASAPSPAPASFNGGGGGMEVVPPAAESHVLASPSTRRLARESNVNINQISGTGLAGRVTRDDVLARSGSAAPSTITTPQAKTSIPKPAYRGPAGATEERVALRGIRKKIAENMQLYKQIIPHFSLMDEADVTELVKMRSALKKEAEKMGVKVTYLPFVMKALIAASRDFPMLNASIDDEAQEIVYKNYFNMGFAADTPQGLLVPVVKNAESKSILEISAEIVELAEKARAGKLSLDEMRGASLTITNIGSIGGTYATPIINHPEVAIFGMYKMTDRPVLVDGKWRARKYMNLSVTADHRLIDGAVATRFMNEVVKRLQNPARLMLDMI